MVNHSNLFHRKGNSFRVAMFKDLDNTPGARKYAKRQASKRVRRYRHFLPNGGAYKHVYNSWDICDFRSDARFGDFATWNDKPYYIKRGGKNYVSR